MTIQLKLLFPATREVSELEPTCIPIRYCDSLVCEHDVVCRFGEQRASMSVLCEYSFANMIVLIQSDALKLALHKCDTVTPLILQITVAIIYNFHPLIESDGLATFSSAMQRLSHVAPVSAASWAA